MIPEETLDAISAQAATADATRSIDADVIAALKKLDVMRMSASRNIGGTEATMEAIAELLHGVSPRCASTAWCLWNHLCTFHLFCGLLGPANAEFLTGIVTRRQWVCFPAGAGTGVRGAQVDGDISLRGKASFGSGARYADWAGVAFVMDDAERPWFSMVDLAQPGVVIEPTWQAMSLRASATDDVLYREARVPMERRVPFLQRYRDPFRDPAHPMVHERYREDWVALSTLWLGAMAAGLAGAALADAAQGIRGRIALSRVKVDERPTVHVNLGIASARVSAARDTVLRACADTDARIAAGQVPDEGDYLRQVSAGMQAVSLCDDAMRLILRVLGGNGLREGTDFERRYRDFQAMPLHINGHIDRVSEQSGRHLIGLPTTNPF